MSNKTFVELKVNTLEDVSKINDIFLRNKKKEFIKNWNEITIELNKKSNIDDVFNEKDALYIKEMSNNYFRIMKRKY
jgi:hypothetical protein